MRPDIVVLATPEIAGLPYVISGLVAAGGMAAAMSTADGLLLAIANALSHDLYYKIIDPKADTRVRLIVARVLLIVHRCGRRGGGEPAAHRHSRRRGLGLLLRLLGALLPPGAGRLVEAGQQARGHRRHDLPASRPGRSTSGPDPHRGHGSDLGHRPSALRHDRHAGQPDRHGRGQPAATEAPDAETQAMVDEVRIPSGETILGAKH